MGFIVAWPGALFKPDFERHIRLTHYQFSTLTGTPYTPRSLSAVSGSGTVADPFMVTVKSALGNTGVTATLTVQYVNGNRHFSKALTLDNAAGTGTTRAAQIMLGAALASPTGDGQTQPIGMQLPPALVARVPARLAAPVVAPWLTYAPHTILLTPHTPA